MSVDDLDHRQRVFVNDFVRDEFFRWQEQRRDWVTLAQRLNQAAAVGLRAYKEANK